MENMSMEQSMTQLQKELRITRIFSIITSVLMVFILIGGIFVVAKVDGYMNEIQPLVEELSTVDFVALSESFQKLEVAMTSVDWEQVSEQVSSLDIDAFNEAIEGLDTEELTETLENINKAVSTMQKISDSIKSFMGKFGL